MNEILSKTCKDLGLDKTKVKLENTSQYGFCLRVTLNNEPILRKNKKYEILDAIKGGVRFTTDKLQSLNNDYTDNKTTYEERQKHVVDEVLAIGSMYPV